MNALDAEYACATEISRNAGSLLGVPAAEAFDALTLVPENLLALLQSPEGWAALASLIAHGLGTDQPSYMPTVH